ncbi:cysteine desulfurase [Lutibacter sp. Hel_I_33_5]|uniref:cysteine desulfurase family protein n=1 Tax=Lutibacter sp. Hel_I_33_5 TaxID=1566289 RepID=UPI00119E958E|nr:cysteine desulfurase family protein [Lutibacter sp. Hel_I_33_5]TVZ57257.1 cysteine desulfurase [Lutibacter sp. Hel_I_33_5]
MNAIYLDNAATTFLDKEVIEVMHQSMIDINGNPSSTHQFGRKAKASIETARKNIAKHFNASAAEIIFTSSGTEADNLILFNAVENLGVKTVITSKVEHHAVLHTLEYLEKQQNINVKYVDVNDKGSINLEHLEQLLKDTAEKTLVSLMLVNNEIGSILPIDKVCKLCDDHNALFHSDTVQAVGQYQIDLQKTPIDFMVASAHKFHGPKGVGFAYFKKGFGIQPMIHGGEQEKGVRSSTENVHSIIGMEKALEISLKNIENNSTKIKALKSYFITELKSNFSNISFNGDSDDLENSSYKILSVRFPVENNMLLFSLDLAGIAVSGGSACQSGSNKGSHVLHAFLNEDDALKTSVRFSFSKQTTKEELDRVVVKLKELL